MQTPDQARAALDLLRDPSRSLPLYGQVHDQETGQFVPYSPTALTERMQSAILEYYTDPPRTADGQTKFLTVLGARQGGKSITAEYAAYPLTAYNPGFDHVCLADVGWRADYLHRRVHFLHERWDEAVRAPTVPSRESRQLTFDSTVGGRMRVLSAESDAAGVGQSMDSFHGSECHLWADFSGLMYLLNPALMNRSNARGLFEATPWEANGDWHDHYLTAKHGDGRHFAMFFPMWDVKLNRRTWHDDWALTNEEIRLLERYGDEGLSKENLAFRRLMLAQDQELRRHPELFPVLYPFDDVTCWILAANAAIPAHALERHVRALLQPWTGPYQRYEHPIPGARYVIGADPCGHAARDHAAFHILRQAGARWKQVATYADHTDPLAFAQIIADEGKAYNNAEVYVESNGVGQGVITPLRLMEYPNIYYEGKGRPGVTTTSKSLGQMTAGLIDALLDELELLDADSVEQMQTYKNDKWIEENPQTEMVRGEPSKRRRDRHHWDKVSAMMMAVVGARRWPSPRIEVQDDAAHDAALDVPHSGFYRHADQARKWAEMQARGATKHDPWFGSGGRFK